MTYNFGRIFFIYFIIILSFFILLSLISYNPSDKSVIYDSTEQIKIYNRAGSFGAQTAAALLYFFGFSAFWLIPILIVTLIMALGYCNFKNNFDCYIAFISIMPLSATLAYIEGIEFFPNIYPGGIVGNFLADSITYIFPQETVFLFLFVISWVLLIIIIMRFKFIYYILLSKDKQNSKKL